MKNLMNPTQYFRLALVLIMAITAGFCFWEQWILFAGAELCVIGFAVSPYLADMINRRRMPTIQENSIVVDD